MEYTHGMKFSAIVPLSVFGLLFSSLVLVFDYSTVREIAGEWRSQSFAQTTGHVLSSKLTTHYGKHISYSADFVYDYTVDGQRFTGTKVDYGRALNSTHAWAQSLLTRYPAGSTTPVYFDRANPSDAVLEPGLRGPGLFTTVFLVPFNVMMIGLWAGLANLLTNSNASRVAGGVQVLEESLVTRARLPRFTPFAAGMLAMAATSFLAIFIVGFGTKMNPSPHTVIATWCVILVVPAVAFLRRWWKIQSGVEDLVLDPGSRVLTLPQTFGRKQVVVVPFNEVKALAVASIEHRTSKGVSQTWAPTIQFKDNRKEEKLVVWPSREKAESFAAWLREKTGLPFRGS